MLSFDRMLAAALTSTPPDSAAEFDHEIDLDLIFVPVVIEARLSVMPGSHRRELLDDEGFEQVSESFAFLVPQFGAQF